MESRTTMDFQAAALPDPGGGSDETAEPRAMDTEDGPDALGRCAGGGRSEEPSRSAPQPGSGSRLEGSGAAAAPELAGGAGGRTELCRGSGRAMEAETAPEVPQGSARWELGAGSAPRGTGRPRTPSSTDPAGMELDETPEPHACPGSAEWTEDVEDEPSEIQGLLAQLETLDPNLRDRSSAPEQGSPSSSGAGARRGRGQCPGKCRPCPLHVATGRGLAMRPCCPQHSACDRPCHGLLFAEADREDLLSLLGYEGGLPEAGAETSLACSDVLAGTNLKMLQAQEEPATVEKPEGLGRPESFEEKPDSWCYGGGLCEDDSACEGPREGSPEPAWAALPSALTPGTEQPPQGPVTVSALCLGLQWGSSSQDMPLGSDPSWGLGWGQRRTRDDFPQVLQGLVLQDCPDRTLSTNFGPKCMFGWLADSCVPWCRGCGSKQPLCSWDPVPSSHPAPGPGTSTLTGLRSCSSMSSPGTLCRFPHPQGHSALAVPVLQGQAGCIPEVPATASLALSLLCRTGNPHHPAQPSKRAPEGESQPMTEVDLFVSTQRIKVLTADTQEAMMDHSLQTISYIADIGSLVVLMARRKLPRRSEVAEEKRLYKMICHVFHSADAQVIARAIGQAFGVAYQRFLEANSIDPSELSPRQYSRALEDQEQYNAELTHFSRQENCKDVCIQKQKGEILGIAIVESGWGSILPTVVIANLMHGGPAERSGELSIGDRLMSVNGTSLVGLPLATCQSIIRELKHQTEVTLNIVHCPPVTTAVIRRPDSKYQLGFCVENGVICSLMRGGIAERGGIRVGHRIIEINGQSVVAMSHEKIIQILTEAVSEVHIKTMPASTYRLLTGQEQPVFL
ncbi:amyloid-beta A4 precursor protein-binding family A member 3 isoform X2 [Parus major]|uniref:amyloid-beta A4 precursor protein-binding family A member 3 isoform X2 n=1 Tax=Parus major TaxID=9157 RepID=UPI000771042D|nr:amyloid-beta A4 precursor protein-binding family A member 3 isoform X2 [Parus major]